jgi:hypothetical protein
MRIHLQDESARQRLSNHSLNRLIHANIFKAHPIAAVAEAELAEVKKVLLMIVIKNDLDTKT